MLLSRGEGSGPKSITQGSAADKIGGTEEFIENPQRLENGVNPVRVQGES